MNKNKKKEIDSLSRWWGDYEIGFNQTLRWQIGPKIIWISRGHKEWKVASTEDQDPVDNSLVVAESAVEPDTDDIDVKRFAVQNKNRKLQLMPALPDRPLIVNASTPFFIPPMQEATLFVSVPLWVRIYIDGGTTELIDSAIIRPSDTWFGPDTMTGNLCYASQTSARLQLDNLPLRPHRAISAARITNNASSMLTIEKLKIPVQNLSIFTTDTGQLWTASLIIEREEGTDNANISLDKDPTQFVASKILTPPRTKMSKGFLLDVFGGLFAKKKEKEND